MTRIPDDPRGTAEELADQIEETLQGWHKGTALAALMGCVLGLLLTAEPEHRCRLVRSVRSFLEDEVGVRHDA